MDNYNYFLKCSNFKKILRQSKLLEHEFGYNNDIINYLLWNKLVKRTMMLKSYEFLKVIFFQKSGIMEKIQFGVL